MDREDRGVRGVRECKTVDRADPVSLVRKMLACTEDRSTADRAIPRRRKVARVVRVAALMAIAEDGAAVDRELPAVLAAPDSSRRRRKSTIHSTRRPYRSSACDNAPPSVSMRWWLS